MEKNNYEEIVLNLYNKYSKKIVDSLINKGILFEFDYGFEVQLSKMDILFYKHY